MLHDRVQLAAAQSHLLAGWGPALSKRAGLADLVSSLASGNAALIRIDLLSGDSAMTAPKSSRVSAASGEPAWRDVELLGPATSSDPQSGGAAFLALWRTAPLLPGTPLRVLITGPGSPQKVLVVPAGAIVRHQGGTFVYVKSSEHGFERRMVTLGTSLPSGVVVTDGLAETDTFVVTGAQQMLATEIMGSSGGEEP